jgi:tRNA(Ile)-lysidine synthase
LHQQGWRWREDRSNRRTDFKRNRVRWRLLPHLRRNFHPEISARLAQSAEILATDDACLQDQAERAGRSAVKRTADGGWRLSGRSLRRLPEALSRRVLTQTWDRLGLPGKTVGHVRGLYSLLVDGKPRRLALPAGWSAGPDGKDVLLRPPVRGPRPVGTQKNQATGYGVELRPCGRAKKLWSAPRGAEYIYMDAKKLDGPLKVRCRRPGETMAPLGMGGRRKSLKKIFQEMRLPRLERERWPVLTCGAEVVWVFRGPMSERFKVEARGSRVCRVGIFPTRR